MKTALLTLLAAAALAAGPSRAATLVYNPPEVAVTVAAGSQGRFKATVTVTGTGGRTYFLWLVDQVQGDIPASWISSTPRTSFINEQNGQEATVLVAVPADAAPGTYIGRLVSRAMAGHGFADPGTGIAVEVHVPSRCKGSPTFEISGFGPAVIWPPDRRMDAVSVTGRVVVPDGCTVVEAGYAIEDEYGLLNAVGSLSPGEAGAFTLSLPVQAWREGRDKDGRHYRITLFVETQLGIARSPVLEAVVPHDRR